MAQCRKCGRKLGGFGGADKPCKMTLEEAAQYHVSAADICEDCLCSEIEKSKSAVDVVGYNPDMSDFDKAMYEFIKNMPAATIQPPSDWNIEVKGVVFGADFVQGDSGMFSEMVVSAMATFKSNPYLNRLTIAKNNAIAKAKKEALEMGANKIYGLQISVSGLSSGQGWIMVTCTGTAIAHDLEHDAAYQRFLKASEAQ